MNGRRTSPRTRQSIQIRAHCKPFPWRALGGAGEYAPQDAKLEIYNTGLKEKWKWINQNEAKPIFYKFIRGNLA